MPFDIPPSSTQEAIWLEFRGQSLLLALALSVDPLGDDTEGCVVKPRIGGQLLEHVFVNTHCCVDPSVSRRSVRDTREQLVEESAVKFAARPYLLTSNRKI